MARVKFLCGSDHSLGGGVVWMLGEAPLTQFLPFFLPTIPLPISALFSENQFSRALRR